MIFAYIIDSPYLFIYLLQKEMFESRYVSFFTKLITLPSEPEIILPCRAVIFSKTLLVLKNVQMEFTDHSEFYIAYLAPVGVGQHISRLI